MGSSESTSCSGNGCELRAKVVHVGLGLEEKMWFPAGIPLGTVVASEKNRIETSKGWSSLMLLRASLTLDNHTWKLDLNHILQPKGLYVLVWGSYMNPEELAMFVSTSRATEGVVFMSRNPCKIMASNGNQEQSVTESYNRYNGEQKSAFLSLLGAQLRLPGRLGIHHDHNTERYKLYYFRVNGFQHFISKQTVWTDQEQFWSDMHSGTDDTNKLYCIGLLFGDTQECGNAWTDRNTIGLPVGELQTVAWQAYQEAVEIETNA